MPIQVGNGTPVHLHRPTRSMTRKMDERRPSCPRRSDNDAGDGHGDDHSQAHCYLRHYEPRYMPSVRLIRLDENWPASPKLSLGAGDDRAWTWTLLPGAEFKGSGNIWWTVRAGNGPRAWGTSHGRGARAFEMVSLDSFGRWPASMTSPWNRAKVCCLSKTGIWIQCVTCQQLPTSSKKSSRRTLVLKHGSLEITKVHRLPQVLLVLESKPKDWSSMSYQLHGRRWVSYSVKRFWKRTSDRFWC